MILVQPVTRAEISDEWIATRREIIVRDGYALRAGVAPTIEIRSLVTNEWCVLVLNEAGARVFASAQDRDEVLLQLMGIIGA